VTKAVTKQQVSSRSNNPQYIRHDSRHWDG